MRHGGDTSRKTGVAWAGSRPALVIPTADQAALVAVTTLLPVRRGAATERTHPAFSGQNHASLACLCPDKLSNWSWPVVLRRVEPYADAPPVAPQSPLVSAPLPRGPPLE